jgi:hypothetical protein
MKTLKDILNEDSAAEIQADETPNNGDSGTLIPIAAGPLTKRALLKAMKKPEGVIQTTSGQQLIVINPKTTDKDTSEMYHEYSVSAMDEDGHIHEVNYEDITQYSEKYHEEDAMALRSMTYDGMEMPKTKIGILTAMKRELRSMKVADIKASYQYIKAAHCNTKEGMQGIGTKKDMLTAMMKDLRGMKKDALMASYGYIKAAHCGPQEGAHEDEMVNASSCTSEDSDLSEAIDFSRVPDDQLIAWLTRFRTVLTKAGLPLKVDRYVKGNPWSDFKKDFANAEKEAEHRGLKVEGVELDEMKTKDDDLAVMIYDYIGADTEGLPLKTLIHQAVGKYFGSQKDKKKVKP